MRVPWGVAPPPYQRASVQRATPSTPCHLVCVVLCCVVHAHADQRGDMQNAVRRLHGGSNTDQGGEGTAWCCVRFNRRAVGNTGDVDAGGI